MSDDAPTTASNALVDPHAALTSPLGRRVIVALAVGQALLLLLFHEAVLRGWPPFGSLTVRCVYLTLVIAVPAALYLLLDDPRRPRPWLLAGALGAALLPVAVFTGLQALPDAHVRSGPIFWPYGLATSAVWFVAVAFLQTARRGRRRFDYEVLFHSGWYHLIALAFTALAVGLFWGVLALWDGLFDVLGITFFGDLFYDRRFVYAATGLVGGLGLVLARSYSGAASTLLRLLLTLLKALLPLVAILALLFLAVLPFTGLSALWETGRPTVLMSVLMGLTILFTNGAFQDGPTEAPYPVVLRRLVEAGLAVLPAYAALSAYALSLRIGQYGWTADRVWAVIVVAVLGAFALAYAVAVFYRRRDGWMRFIEPANTALALALAAVLWLTQTPLLSPQRIAVGDQIERLRRGAVDDTEDVLRYLRFNAGERGYRALRRLKDEDALAGRSGLIARINSVLSDTSRYGRTGRSEPAATATPANLRDALDVVPDSEAVVPSALLSFMKQHPARLCARPAHQCLLLSADLYNGPPSEYVLFDDYGRHVQSYVFAARADSTWEQADQLETLRDARADSLMQALRAGRVQTTPSRWRDLVVGGVRLEVR